MSGPLPQFQPLPHLTSHYNDNYCHCILFLLLIHLRLNLITVIDIESKLFLSVIRMRVTCVGTRYNRSICIIVRVCIDFKHTYLWFLPSIRILTAEVIYIQFKRQKLLIIKSSYKWIHIFLFSSFQTLHVCTHTPEQQRRELYRNCSSTTSLHITNAHAETIIVGCYFRDCRCASTEISNEMECSIQLTCLAQVTYVARLARFFLWRKRGT